MMKLALICTLFATFAIFMTNGLPQSIDEIAQQGLDNIQDELESKYLTRFIQATGIPSF